MIVVEDQIQRELQSSSFQRPQTQTNKVKNKNKLVESAPHRIVNWKALQDTVNPLLDKCSVCKQEGLKLVEKSRISLASTFEIECATCKWKEEKLEQHIFYLQRQHAEAKSRKLYVDIANKKATLKILKASLRGKRVHPIPNKN